jgi:hypothetical protein
MKLRKLFREKAGCDHGVQAGDELGDIAEVANEYLQVKSISFGKGNIRAISHCVSNWGGRKRDKTIRFKTVRISSWLTMER